MEINTDKLNNGAQLLVEKHSDAQLIATCLKIELGSTIDPTEKKGITHLLEHFLLRKLELDLNAKTPENKYTIEAQTTETSMSLILISSHETFKKNLKTLIHSSFREELSTSFFDQEIGAVSQELREYEIEPNFPLKARKQAFNTYSYGDPVIGSSNSVHSISVIELNMWKKKLFQSNNLSIFVSGCVDDSLYFAIKQIISQIPLSQSHINSSLKHSKKRFLLNKRTIINNGSFIAKISLIMPIYLKRVNTQHIFYTSVLLSLLREVNKTSLLNKVKERFHNVYSLDIIPFLQENSMYLQVITIAPSESSLPIATYIYKLISSLWDYVSDNDLNRGITSVLFFQKVVTDGVITSTKSFATMPKEQEKLGKRMAERSLDVKNTSIRLFLRNISMYKEHNLYIFNTDK